MWSCEHFAKHISQAINHFHLASPDKRGIWEATPGEVKRLENLNNQFTEIEKVIAVEGNQIKTELQARLEAQDEQFLDDFEVDVEISYYLGEDDSAYTDQDEEGIIAIDNIFGIPDDGDDEINWNDNAGSMEGQKHCHLFHSLTDHITPKLKLADVLRHPA